MKDFEIIVTRKENNMTEKTINQINEYARENKFFWVAGLASETWEILQYHLNELSEPARIAVEHYKENSK